MQRLKLRLKGRASALIVNALARVHRRILTRIHEAVWASARNAVSKSKSMGSGRGSGQMRSLRASVVAQKCKLHPTPKTFKDAN